MYILVAPSTTTATSNLHHIQPPDPLQYINGEGKPQFEGEK
jgi:hypothetical protein